MLDKRLNFMVITNTSFRRDSVCFSHRINLKWYIRYLVFESNLFVRALETGEKQVSG